MMLFDEIVMYSPEGIRTVLVDYLCPWQAHPSDERGQSHIDSETKTGGRVVVPEGFLVDAVKELHANATACCKQRLEQLALELLSDKDHLHLKLRREDLDLVIRCCAQLIELAQGMVTTLSYLDGVDSSSTAIKEVRRVVELVSELPPVLVTLRAQAS